jgi:ketosteroid isomerase-like protein
MGSSETRARTLAGFMLLAAGLLLAGSATAKRHDPAGDRAAIEDIRRQLAQAENAGDAGVFAHIAADDIAVMPPNVGLVLGREANVNATRDLFEKFTLKVEYGRSVVEVRGDTAIDRGMYSQTLTPKSGGTPVASRGCYLWVYRRTLAGDWQLSHAIWNVD